MYSTNNTDTYAQIAADEGYSLATLKAAARRVRDRELAVRESLCGFQALEAPAHVDIEDLVVSFSRSCPVLCGPLSTDMTASVAALEAIPLDAVVTETTDDHSGRRVNYFRRTGAGFVYFGFACEASDRFRRSCPLFSAQDVADELGVKCSSNLQRMLSTLTLSQSPRAPSQSPVSDADVAAFLAANPGGALLRAIGRVLKEDILHPETRQPLAREGEVVTFELMSRLETHGVDDPVF